MSRSRRSKSDRWAAARWLPAFAAGSALRPEEWAALERRHIDRVRRVVRVEQKNVDAVILPGGKTKNSVREVPLTVRALEALDALQLRFTGLLFPAPNGAPLNLDNFRRREWSPAVETSGVERPARIYDLRSTFASSRSTAAVLSFTGLMRAPSRVR